MVNRPQCQLRVGTLSAMQARDEHRSGPLRMDIGEIRSAKCGERMRGTASRTRAAKIKVVVTCSAEAAERSLSVACRTRLIREAGGQKSVIRLDKFLRPSLTTASNPISSHISSDISPVPLQAIQKFSKLILLPAARSSAFDLNPYTNSHPK